MRKWLDAINAHVEKIRYPDLTIFTSTFYRYNENTSIENQDVVRSNLAIKTIENANKLWIHLVVLDGWSCEDFLSKIRKFLNITIIEADDTNNIKSLSMWEARRMALEIAREKYNTDFYLWMEPEKDNLITKENIDPLMQEARTEKHEIIIPKRKNKASYPDFQAREETRANKELSSLMYKYTNKNWDTKEWNTKEYNAYDGEEYDLFFWPKLFSKKVIDYFLSYKSTLDKSDAIITPILIAHQNWVSVWSKEIDYTYDITQKENEESSPKIKSINKKWKNRNRKIIDTKRLEQYVYILEETKKQLKIKQKIKSELWHILSNKEE